MIHRSPVFRSLVFRPCATLSRVLVILGVVLVGAFSSALAQGHKVDTNQFWMKPYGPLPSTPPYTTRPIYGLNPDEFWIGAYSETRPDDGNWYHFWDWCDSMGFKIIERRADIRWSIRDNHPDIVDSLIDAAKPYDTAFGGWRQRVISVIPWMSQAGFGTEMVLFPFDSAANYYYQHRFLSRAGGVRDTNRSMNDDWGQGAREQVYDTTNTTPGTEIAASMILGADTTLHKHRWWAVRHDQQVYPRNFSPYKPTIPDEYPLATPPPMPQVDSQDINFRRIYIVVRGHLFSIADSGRGYGVGTNDVLLELRVYDEVQDSMYYRPHLDSALRRSLGGPTSRLYKTLYLTKGMIQPPVDPATFPLGQQQREWDAYREVVFAVDMVSDPVTRVTGPWDPRKAENSGPYGQADAHGRDFDLRVKWTGNEKLAVRAVILRDSLAQLVQQTGGQNDTLRSYALNYTYRILRGAAWAIGSPAPLVDSVLERRRRVFTRAYVGDEGENPTSSSFSWADSLLYRTFGSVVPDPDSLQRGLRGWRGNNGRNVHAWMASTSELTPEVYFPKVDNPDTVAQKNYTSTYFGVDLGNAPSIREHNGGRFLTPELGLTDDSVRTATRLMQRMIFGQALPDPQFWPQISNLGQLLEGARKARATGHPLIMWCGSMVRFFLKNRRVDSVTVVRDTMLGHLQEAADYRALINLGLCYGTRGIHYSYLGFNQNQYAGRELGIGSDTTYYAFDGPDLGMLGSRTSTDTINHLDAVLYTDPWLNPQRRDTIPNLYTGWKNQTTAVKWLNRTWIPAVWPYLKRLKWRDGYSAHFTVQQDYGYFDDSGAVAGAVVRPFAATEIVQGVRTYDRFGRLDSARETYVEIGLFDSIPGWGGYDTNYVMICQRRTFERPEDVSPGSARGKLMDSLAEWRKVFVQLHMTHPDSGHYNYVRVKELPGAADTTRAPWWNAPRTPLDTVVHLDSAVALWMRPGGGALLQITHVNPSNDFVGNLAFNNGKKVFFDGIRYHMVMTYFEFGKNDTNSMGDYIYYYWSQPVDSLERAVRWGGTGSGMEILNMQLLPCDTFLRYQNRHPSLTVRRIGDSALVTVVWTCHPPSGVFAPNTREVVTRSVMLGSSGYLVSKGGMQTVGYYRGANPTGSGIIPPPPPGPTSASPTLSSSFWGAWGTPVVSTLDGAEVFAWSDSLAGIVARLHTTGTAHLPCVPVFWSNYDTVSSTFFASSGCIPGKAQWPTMPPVAHVTSLDSNVGIAWQNSANCAGNVGNIIYYKRLVHSGTLPTPVLTSQNDLLVTPPGFYEHPSLDLWQSTWYQCFEGVAFEEKTGTWPYLGSTLWFRPIYTETRLRGGWNPFWDSLEASVGWVPYSQIVRSPGGSTPSGYLDLRPSAAPLNEIMVPADSLDTAHFVIAYVDSTNTAGGAVLDLWQTKVWYGMSTATPGFPKRYSFPGFHPAMSGSATKQETRAVMLYESNHDANAYGNAVIGPTHQFFARLTRPRGYLATGREVWMLDTASVGASVGMMDLWVSDDDSSRSLAMGVRTSTHLLTDTLDRAVGMVHSAVFATHDSAVVGVRTRAQMRGDSTYATSAGMAVHLRWELIEESSGSVVAVLDSTTVDAAHPTHDSLVERVFDLVSGSYRVRMTADTVGITPRALSRQESRWPVVETSIWVEELAAKMVRTGEASGSRARLEVQPNPATDHAEVMVSVPSEGEVHITLTSIDGRAVGVIYEGVLDRGRYSVPVSLANVRPGAYLVELVAGRQRLVRKLVVR